MSSHILVIDQGTTSTRAIAFDRSLRPRATAQIELTQHYPKPGWVEHDPEEIWRAVVQVCREAMDEIGGPEAVACLGITNQRETVVVWERETGRAIHPAIVWQDRRTAETCAGLRAQGLEHLVQRETGLLLDPYFSATKLGWILDNVPGARVRAAHGGLAFGTVESFLIWRLTGGRHHVTDATNAARTLMLSLDRLTWDEDLLGIFEIPAALLPDIRACTGPFGETVAHLFGRSIPITGAAGDQQAALIGHGCLDPGEAKVTYGTGAFLVSHAGATPPRSQHRLLSTLAYALEGERAYALEGSIFSAGATVQWLRDGLGAIGASRESEAMAAQLADNGGVYLVPAFAGLGAPQWRAEARGAIVGLTRDSTVAHIVRAGLEAIAYQTQDLIEAMAADGAAPSDLRVDGGVTANAWAMQFLADVCNAPVERPAFQEVTALGAAKLAALGAGLIGSLREASTALSPARFMPKIAPEARAQLLAGWRAAVGGVLAHAGPG